MKTGAQKYAPFFKLKGKKTPAQGLNVNNFGNWLLSWFKCWKAWFFEGKTKLFLLPGKKVHNYDIAMLIFLLLAVMIVFLEFPRLPNKEQQSMRKRHIEGVVVW